MTFDDPSLFDKAGVELLAHLGHKITITSDGGAAAPDDIAIKCEDCHATLIDFCPEPEARTVVEQHMPLQELAQLRLVTEFHYCDGDVGAYDDLDVRDLWTHFTKSHKASHIVIRPNTGQGQQISNNLFNAANMITALSALVDTINATGGVIPCGGGLVVPVADREWLDLGSVYMAACSALGLKPKTAD